MPRMAHNFSSTTLSYTGKEELCILLIISMLRSLFYTSYPNMCSASNGRAAIERLLSKTDFDLPVESYRALAERSSSAHRASLSSTHQAPGEILQIIVNYFSSVAARPLLAECSWGLVVK